MADRIPGSFRDPSGFLFERDGTLYRQVNRSFSSELDRFVECGLYEELASDGSLIPHEEVAIGPADPATAYKILRPERIPFVSYPYEWSFSQLKDAALLTLTLQERALARGMALKDASAYNVQFRGGKPIFIDTLSFEGYREGQPWVAYRQFCRHFLAPLALMSRTDVRLQALLRAHIDGIPLDLASKLLPGRSRLRFGLLTHLHLHASSEQRHADRDLSSSARSKTMSKQALLGLVDSLKGAVAGLSWQPRGTQWAAYYDDTNYSEEAFRHKASLVEQALDELEPTDVWDLGANTGVFSRLAAKRSIPTVAFDIDPAAVEQNYLDVRRDGESRLLPLLLDLTNPSPGLGLRGRERASLAERGPADLVLALALVHHLAIGNNVPLPEIASLLSELGRKLVVEWIPKEDSQVQRLLRTREDVFDDYTQEAFEAAFSAHFEIRRREPVKGAKRTVYSMAPCR